MLHRVSQINNYIPVGFFPGGEGKLDNFADPRGVAGIGFDFADPLVRL